jgi:ribosomal protein S18 acetylase RimI-like enzyme
VRIHLRAFPDNFITPMGTRMVRLYYDALTTFSGGRCLVYRNESGEVLGFVAGVVSPGNFFRFLVLRYSLRAALSAVHSNPRALWELGRRLFSRLFSSRVCDRGIVPDAECNSFAVDPLVRDPSIAAFLTAAFLLDLRQRGARTVMSGVRADNPRLLRFARLFGYREIYRDLRPNGHEMRIMLWSEEHE